MIEKDPDYLRTNKNPTLNFKKEFYLVQATYHFLKYKLRRIKTIEPALTKLDGTASNPSPKKIIN